MQTNMQIKMRLDSKEIKIKNSNKIVKKDNTIVDKIVYLLGASSDKVMHLKDMYSVLKNHSQASVRGNLNRHISKMKENSLIKRVSIKDDNGKEIKGYYTLAEVVTVKKNEATNEITINFIAKYNVDGNEVAFIHKDYVYNEETSIEPGVYSSEKVFENIQDVFKEKESLEGIVANADAREILSRLQDNSFDLLVTDPPYKVISGGKPKKKGQPSGMLSKNDGKIFKHNSIKFSEWLPDVYRVLKEGAHAYIFTNLLNLWELKDECEKVGFRVHNLLVWEKSNAVVNRWYMKNCEYVLFLRKGPAKAINNMGSKTVHQFDNIVGNKLHPTEKPQDLLEFYVNNSIDKNKTNWVLDPFGGSLSLARALLNKGIKFFSIEKDKVYYNKGLNDLSLMLETI